MDRLGWCEGFHLLVSANPQGVITGFSFAPASAKDQPMAEDFFAFRHSPQPRVPTIWDPAVGYYVVDKGFEGQDRHQHWHHHYGAQVVCPPKRNSHQPWPKQLRHWVAGLRQIIETVKEKQHNAFRLDRERPHALAGFQTRLAAKAEHVQPRLDSLAYRVDSSEGSVVLTGDTRPCPSVTGLAKGADLLLCMCWDDQEIMEQNGEFDGQCGTTGAARMAQEAGVKKLVLVHIGPHLSGH